MKSFKWNNRCISRHWVGFFFARELICEQGRMKNVPYLFAKSLVLFASLKSRTKRIDQAFFSIRERVSEEISKLFQWALVRKLVKETHPIYGRVSFLFAKLFANKAERKIFGRVSFCVREQFCEQGRLKKL